MLPADIAPLPTLRQDGVFECLMLALAFGVEGLVGALGVVLGAAVDISPAESANTDAAVGGASAGRVADWFLFK